MNGPVLVTGATGNVGGAVVRALTAANMPVRVAGTSTKALADRFPGMETAHLDFRIPATFEPALDGAAGLFLMRPPRLAKVGSTLNTLIDVAERQGMAHVVLSSVVGAETNRLLPHHRVESRLRAARLPWTILRPGFFAQNLADAYRADIVGGDRIFIPAGEGKAAFIDVRDVGDVTASVFADPAAHRGRGYTLTGRQALDFREVVAILTRHVSRTIRYEPATVPGYMSHLRRQGLPLTQILVYTVLNTGLRRGDAEKVDPSLSRLLGRAPRTLEQYVKDHRNLWATGPV